MRYTSLVMANIVVLDIISCYTSRSLIKGTYMNLSPNITISPTFCARLKRNFIIGTIGMTSRITSVRILGI